MWKNYIKIAFRNMAKHRGYTVINIAGLAIGVTVCFLLSLWVKDELSYDRFHSNAEHIYRALWKARFGDNEWNIPLVPVPIAPTLEKEFPEVETTTQFIYGGSTFKKGTEFVREQNIAFADNRFFDVFTVQFISGDPKTALEEPDAIVLTQESAEKYFPDQNAIGKTIERNDGVLFKVTGIVKDFPAQSHFHFGFLLPLKTLSIVEQRKDQWGSATVYTYLKLRPGSDANALNEKFQAYVDKNIVDEAFRTGSNYTSFPLQSLLDIHLKSNLETELETNGNLSYIYLFGIIGFIILLLACINFVNLATARSMTRAREVGVRKVLGSQRSQLIRQFFAESFLYVAIAVIITGLLANLLLPAFNDFTGKTLTIDFLNSPFVLALLAGFALLVTLLAGSFPAFFLSSFAPLSVLKGSVVKIGGKEFLRKGLVVTQFCISTALIVGTLVVWKQLDFLQNERLGFNKEQVLVIDRASALGQNYNAFLDKLRGLPQVVKASATQFLPGREFSSSVFVPEQPSNYKETSLTFNFADEQFVEALKLEMVEGRNFSRDLASDSSAFLINETAAKALGWDKPIGRQLNYSNFIQGPVIGVVKDFHFESLHHEMKPLIILHSRWNNPLIAVRLQAGNMNNAIANIQNAWKEFAPTSVFEYTFLDEDYQQLYEKEQRMGQVFIAFSILAIFIACLGLFGLSAYIAEQRTKEIGIRKVLGASVAHIAAMLSKDFVKLVIIAAVIAFPLAWWGMSKWLEDFAYRTSIEWWMFVVAGIGALMIAILTVSFQAIRAAVSNPVESLKSE
ncbi:MAG: ABC transporter permease [Saprospiraceae bacterium]|nr:ABC transporter permease [Saprospiraceae bacterium]